jgi:hypothetical protein
MIQKIAWLKIVNPGRINQRIIGSLGGRSLHKAKRLVNAAASAIGNNGNINNNNTTYGIGSIYAYEEDFIKLI